MNSELARWERVGRDYNTSRGLPHPLPPVPRPPPQRSFSNPAYFHSVPQFPSFGSRPSSSGQDGVHWDGAAPAAAAYSHRRRTSGDQYRSPEPIIRDPTFRYKPDKMWPPRRYDPRDVLTEEEAESLIARGANTFKGMLKEFVHSPGNLRFFAIMESESNRRTDRASVVDDALAAATLPVLGPADSPFPWASLEQPCMRYAYGRSPGTTTLTYYVGKSGQLFATNKYGSDSRPRKLKMGPILERLHELEMGIDEEHPQETYHNLYDKLIDDPDRFKECHYDRAYQIADLIGVLVNKEWIDFSQPRNQIVGKFVDSPEEKIRLRFFFQLLLATELHLRVYSEDHLEGPRSSMMENLPPKVGWDLALAQRWLENMSISRTSISAERSTFDLILRSKSRQKDALRAFARALKWPNMEEVDYVLAEQDTREKDLEDRSAESMSWFSGVILPGPTLPFVAINALIECDKDTDGQLNFLSHMYANCGFQYRGSTYWSSHSILGKVLGAARGVREVSGWIGPCPFSPDLDRTECLLTLQYASREPRLTAADVQSMASRSHPLGPETEGYPLSDFEILVPDTRYTTDLIRVEKLSFREVPADDPDSRTSRALSRHNVRTYAATAVFAMAGQSYYLKCKYNVDFVCAFGCVGGPHPLWRRYRYRAVRVDAGLVQLRDWPDRNGRGKSRSRSAHGLGPAHAHSHSMPTTPTRIDPRVAHGRRASDENARASAYLARSTSPSAATDAAGPFLGEVLVIEAFGVSDNEVFARAWCAHWGLNALVANVKQTCLACAVREAYAAYLSVVILTEGGLPMEFEGGSIV